MRKDIILHNGTTVTTVVAMAITYRFSVMKKKDVCTVYKIQIKKKGARGHTHTQKKKEE